MKLGICGICGRMGIAVLKVLTERGHQLGAAFDAESSPGFGNDVGLLMPGSPLGVRVTSINSGDTDGLDGIIDFSSTVASLQLLEIAREKKKPVVIGTTGFGAEERKKIEEAARDIPVLFSPNMSVGVNLLFKITEMAARALGTDYDVEIFEAHHRYKKDAPSGTAKRLVDAVKASREGLRNAREVSGREGIIGERGDDEIGVMAMRGGDIVGEHTVFFAAAGERIELTHRATSRDIFARGAVIGMEYLSQSVPGLYTMYDVLGL